MPDADFKTKCRWQSEYLGYIDLTTGKPEDRKKLFVQDIRPLRSKKDNATWAYAVFTRSVGTGKNGRFTVREWAYKFEPFLQGDIIEAKEYHKERGYWYLDSYQIVV